MPKSCFVISPIGEPNSEIREHADDVFDFIIKPAVDRTGHIAKRADHAARPGPITDQMYDAILGDNLLIALLTFHNPNVFYEVAVAEAAARPLVLLLDKSHKIPFDIHNRRVIYYDLKPRPLFSGQYVDQLARAIVELEAAGDDLKVPFRPALKPLGSGESAWRFLGRAEDVPRSEYVNFVKKAQSFLWLHGIALFAFPKIVGFQEALAAALSKGLEVRVLLMHPENQGLVHLVRDFAPDYLGLVQKEIHAGAAFWQEMSKLGALSLRFQTKGAMFSNFVISDQSIIATQYSLARATSESPTMIAPASAPFYSVTRQDFEWAWNRASPAL
jgi:hypothetical protein